MHRLSPHVSYHFSAVRSQNYQKNKKKKEHRVWGWASDFLYHLSSRCLSFSTSGYIALLVEPRSPGWKSFSWAVPPPRPLSEEMDFFRGHTPAPDILKAFLLGHGFSISARWRHVLRTPLGALQQFKPSFMPFYEKGGKSCSKQVSALVRVFWHVTQNWAKHQK